MLVEYLRNVSGGFLFRGVRAPELIHSLVSSAEPYLTGGIMDVSGTGSEVSRGKRLHLSEV